MADETIPPPLPPQSSPTATASRTEPLAIFSLVLAILSWFFCLLLGSIPAIVCGHLLVPGFAGQTERFEG
jgi:hypothetical protein